MAQKLFSRPMIFTHFISSYFFVSLNAWNMTLILKGYGVFKLLSTQKCVWYVMFHIYEIGSKLFYTKFFSVLKFTVYIIVVVFNTTFCLLFTYQLSHLLKECVIKKPFNSINICQHFMKTIVISNYAQRLLI